MRNTNHSIANWQNWQNCKCCPVEVELKNALTSIFVYTKIEVSAFFLFYLIINNKTEVFE